MNNIGVRKRIWEQGSKVEPRDVAEAVRDLDSSVRSILPMKLVTTDVVWTLPYTLAADHRPRTVTVKCVETPATPLTGISAFPSPMWSWKNDAVEIFRADGFVVGTRYIITWELLG